MTLGVLGTMVWDRIDHPDGDRVERWGGIAYALAAAAAALPDGWHLRPIIKLGADLADEARAFLRSVPGLESEPGIVQVDAPNNRVHLRYRNRQDREEQLTGGVPGWSWAELKPRLAGLDGLYVNMISGFELDAAVATALRHHFPQPRYVDIHSLVLDVADDGRRVPRSVPDRDAWLDGFHVIQVNRAELETLAGEDDPDRTARAAVAAGARAVLVTRGDDGATWFAPGPGPVWPGGDSPGGGTLESTATGARVAAAYPETGGDAVQNGEVAVDRPWTAGDPTGCGDVWGATCFLELMQGVALTDAMAAANRAAAANVDHRGADGLYQHLRTGL